MADWPNELLFPDDTPHISPTDQCSIGAVTGNLVEPISQTWLNANFAVYVPFRLNKSVSIITAFVINGAVASSGVCVGIYDADGVRLLTTGSTNASTVSTLQTITTAATMIGPGLFYMGLSCLTSTQTIFSTASPNVQALRALGLATQQTAFPLPSTATFATISSSVVPAFGFTCRSSL